MVFTVLMIRLSQQLAIATALVVAADAIQPYLDWVYFWSSSFLPYLCLLFSYVVDTSVDAHAIIVDMKDIQKLA
jgi:hypothetical protein